MIGSRLNIVPIGHVPRPPLLLPRARALNPDVKHRLQEWVRHALALPVGAQIGVSEWIDLDVRAAAQHVVHIVATTPTGDCNCTIPKASVRIVAADVATSLEQSSLQVSRPPTQISRR